MSQDGCTENACVRTPPQRASIPVPLVVPRHQKKVGKFGNEMHVEESQHSDGSPGPVTPGEILRHRSVEALTIRQGQNTYNDSIRYQQPYALFRHGKHTYVSQSVGYSSDGELVLHKETVSSASDGELSLKPEHVSISKAVCMTPNLKRETPGDAQAVGKKKKTTPKKYPGVKAPRSQRLRNRLHNDNIARVGGAADDEELGPDDVMGCPVAEDASAVGLFSLQGVDAEKVDRLLRLSSMDAAPRSRRKKKKAKDPSAARFNTLPSSMKSELLRAVDSEPLSDLMADLDKKFASLIDDDTATEVNVCLEQGYARLVCHGVAQYYGLVSKSHGEGEARTTRVTVPANHDCQVPPKGLLQLLLERRNAWSTMDN